MQTRRGGVRRREHDAPDLAALDIDPLAVIHAQRDGNGNREAKRLRSRAVADDFILGQIELVVLGLDHEHGRRNLREAVDLAQRTKRLGLGPGLPVHAVARGLDEACVESTLRWRALLGHCEARRGEGESGGKQHLAHSDLLKLVRIGAGARSVRRVLPPTIHGSDSLHESGNSQPQRGPRCLRELTRSFGGGKVFREK